MCIIKVYFAPKVIAAICLLEIDLVAVALAGHRDDQSAVKGSQLSQTQTTRYVHVVGNIMILTIT